MDIHRQKKVYMMGNNNQYPTTYWVEWADKIIATFNLKRHGQEYKGPCPSCGGADRFWINNIDGIVRLGCRGCDDFQGIVNIMQSYNCWPMPTQTSKPHRDPDVPFGALEVAPPPPPRCGTAWRASASSAALPKRAFGKSWRRSWPRYWRRWRRRWRLTPFPGRR